MKGILMCMTLGIRMEYACVGTGGMWQADNVVFRVAQPLVQTLIDKRPGSLSHRCILASGHIYVLWAKVHINAGNREELLRKQTAREVHFLRSFSHLEAMQGSILYLQT